MLERRGAIRSSARRRGREPRGAGARGAAGAGLGRAAGARSRSTSGSRSRPGWPADRPTRPRRCGWRWRSRPGAPRRSTRSPPSSAPTCRASCCPGLALGTGAGEIVEPSSRWPSTRSWWCPRSSRCRPRTSTGRPIGSGCRAPTPSWRPLPGPRRGARARRGAAASELIVNDLEPAALSLCPWSGRRWGARRGGRRARDRVRLGPDGGGDLVGAGSASRRAFRAARTCWSELPAGGASREPVTAEFAAPSLT